MNIFNKTLLAISLAVAIPLSTQAHWFGSLTDTFIKKKKTIIACTALGCALSYANLKLFEKLNNRISQGKKFVFEGFDKLEKAKRRRKIVAIVSGLSITAGLMYIANRYNLFLEKT